MYEIVLSQRLEGMSLQIFRAVSQRSSLLSNTFLTNSSCLDFLKLIYHFNEIRSQGSTLVSPPCDLEIVSRKKIGIITKLSSFVSLWSGTICCPISENSCSIYFVWFSSYLWWEGNSYSSSFLLEKGEVLIPFNNKSAFTFHSLYSSREKTGFQSQRWWY